MSPSIEKIPPKTPNPPGSEGTHVPTGATSNPTSTPAGDLKHDATRQSLRPNPTMHQEANPISPKSFGLGAHGGQQSSEGPSVLRPAADSYVECLKTFHRLLQQGTFNLRASP
jgi:hypothetical protein